MAVVDDDHRTLGGGGWRQQNPSTLRQNLEPLRVAAMVGVGVASQASKGRLDVGAVVNRRQGEQDPGFATVHAGDDTRTESGVATPACPELEKVRVCACR